MPLRSILRAIQPLRSSIVKSATNSAPATHQLQFSKPSIISGLALFRRSNSSTTSAKQQESPSTPSFVSPLRVYPYKLKTGTVETVGRMDRTVRVSHRHTSWDPHLRKSYPRLTTFMVSDPKNSLREGDVIEFSSGYPKSRHVRHVVERIIAPYGTNIEDRPPVMTREEREAERAAKRAAKLQRREARGLESGGKEHVGRIKRLIRERTDTGVE
ncbi:hypothetical protein EYZ11_001673 [Aspergillus tanneri]|uniref:Nucleic acid-binding protein n=1 Tax=Aspergillus tanneri TaxID=1220188 RepID=A0A4S3JSV3_9EURO|nr:uncharacterized protein ATNIH1004_002423 [Aspergillus tanneri]KAA8649749.1 hypothetical protein ATNIH1004_002423 [Aspergillus tanneri]THC98826.1 hypothetical protein EYZ11_001673 [Aspergillus tanneri]